MIHRSGVRMIFQNKAASETSGNKPENPMEKSNDLAGQKDADISGSDVHPAKTPDIQETPTRSTGFKTEEVKPEDNETHPVKGKREGGGREKGEPIERHQEGDNKTAV